MQTIWKYEIEPDFIIQLYKMPIGASILSFGLDGNDKLCFWARVDDKHPLEEHAVICVGTGWELDHVFNTLDTLNESVCFIGSLTHGPYVWHLFDIGGGLDFKRLKLATQSGAQEAPAQNLIKGEYKE